MKRRREHGECEAREGGRGCLVFETKICEYKRKRMGRLQLLKEWLSNSRKGKEVLWWIIVAMIGVGLSGALMLVKLALRI